MWSFVYQFLLATWTNDCPHWLLIGLLIIIYYYCCCCYLLLLYILIFLFFYIFFIIYYYYYCCYLLLYYYYCYLFILFLLLLLFVGFLLLRFCEREAWFYNCGRSVVIVFIVIMVYYGNILSYNCFPNSTGKIRMILDRLNPDANPTFSAIYMVLVYCALMSYVYI